MFIVVAEESIHLVTISPLLLLLNEVWAVFLIESLSRRNQFWKLLERLHFPDYATHLATGTSTGSLSGWWCLWHGSSLLTNDRFEQLVDHPLSRKLARLMTILERVVIDKENRRGQVPDFPQMGWPTCGLDDIGTLLVGHLLDDLIKLVCLTVAEAMRSYYAMIEDTINNIYYIIFDNIAKQIVNKQPNSHKQILKSRSRQHKPITHLICIDSHWHRLFSNCIPCINKTHSDSNSQTRSRWSNPVNDATTARKRTSLNEFCKTQPRWVLFLRSHVTRVDREGPRG